MKIGIDASRAFLKNRTGIEEYSYQTIKNLRDNLQSHQARLASTSKSSYESRQVLLYIRKNQEVDFELPENWKIKIIKWPRFWTQVGLSLEMLFNKVDALFIPAHTVPLIHPKNTIVVIHGLEYEFCPEAYSFLERMYMRWTIKKSCKWASKIISVSENTKKDLVKLYNVSDNKISVIYEGYSRQGRNFKFQISNFKSNSNDLISNSKRKETFYTKYNIQDTKYFLFIGRIEVRKNISNVVKAFELFKEKNGTDYKLVLAGRPGYGYESIKSKVQSSKFKDDIIELGYISEEEKWELLKNADAFVFATLYEGFGIPILEAQSVNCPVIASSNSSIPEVVNGSALLVDPFDEDVIADAMHKIVTDQELKNDIIAKGLENIKRFSWSKCAKQIAEIIWK